MLKRQAHAFGLYAKRKIPIGVARMKARAAEASRI
jgi:hypothetical protein